jgi:hypothetical protein
LVSGQDAGLLPLDFYGGPTRTHALRLNSPAINKGNNAQVPVGTTTDQRGPGFARIVGEMVDIGAFEALSAISLAGLGIATAAVPYSVRLNLTGALRGAPGTRVTIDWGDDDTTDLTFAQLTELANTGFVTVTHTFDTPFRTHDVVATAFSVAVNGGGPVSSIPHEVNVGRDTGDSLYLFRETGGTDTGKATAMEMGNPVNSIVINEGDSFLAELSRQFTIDENMQKLHITFTDLVFDDSSTQPLINDAFELALFDANGNSLAATIGIGRDAFSTRLNGPMAAVENPFIRSPTMFRFPIPGRQLLSRLTFRVWSRI